MTSATERQIIDHEGFRPYAYQDSRGYWTIGYGRLVDVRLGGGITLEEGLYLLRNDIAKHEHELVTAFPWVNDLDEVRRRVLVDMAFNLGVGRLAQFKNTLADVKRGNWERAAAGMRNSLWARQVSNRAERLSRMMESGEEQPKWW